MNPALAESHGGWLAHLDLEFGNDGRGTVLRRRGHRGPLVIQRPFYPEGPDVIHTYIVHPPGGVVGGDRLELEVGIGNGAHAVVTTPAAAKFYRSGGQRAAASQRFQLDEGALLEWLPQETIFYPGAEADLVTRIDARGRAGFVAWEVQSLGLPAAGQPFRTGHCVSRLEVYRDGRPVLLDHGAFIGGDRSLQGPWGYRGRSTTGILVAGPLAGAGDGLAGSIRRVFESAGPDAALSQVRDMLVVRAFDDWAQPVIELFRRIWSLLRPELTGRPPCPPRIWST